MIQDATLPGTGLPPAVRRVSWILERLLGLGVPVGPLYLLETRGWRTGTARTVPVAVIRFGGRRWLVSVFGETGWVRNIRVIKVACLRRGRRAETIRVAEVDDKRRPVVAMRLRRSFRFIPFVRQAFGATPRDGIAAFQAEAHRHPVFLIDDRLEET
jgi:deazaflavin-dependent oxidoreductase (nitroreductase family)